MLNAFTLALASVFNPKYTRCLVCVVLNFKGKMEYTPAVNDELCVKTNSLSGSSSSA